MIVFTNDSKTDMEELVRLHNDATERLKDRVEYERVVNSMPSAIRSLADTIRDWNDKIMKKTQVNRDALLGSLRRVRISYERLSALPNALDNEICDMREIHSLAFFQNALAFLRVAENVLPEVGRDKLFQRSLGDIQIIRNCFAHSYDYDFQGRKYVIRIDFNHHRKKEGAGKIFELEVFDMDTSEKIDGLHYSINKFYLELIQIIVMTTTAIINELKTNV